MTASMPMPPEADAVLYDEASIRAAVQRLGAEISRDYAGDEVRLITVLKGGLPFLTDLARAIDLPCTLDFMAVLQYTPGVGGVVRVTKDLDDDITGSRVLLVEDVVDTGLTVNYVMKLLASHSPRSLEVCTLIDKPARRIAEVPIHYRGFTAPDRFLVGYGLDIGGRYRNLPYIATVKDEAMGL